MELYNYIFNSYPITIIFKNNEPWFYAHQVAIILEYKKIDKIIKNHDKNIKNFESFLEVDSLLDALKPDTKFINKVGLQRLIVESLSSTKNQFQEWIYNVVLPIIRLQYDSKLKFKTTKTNFQNLIKNNSYIIQNDLELTNKIDKIIQKDYELDRKEQMITRKNQEIAKKNQSITQKKIDKDNEQNKEALTMFMLRKQIQDILDDFIKQHKLNISKAELLEILNI